MNTCVYTSVSTPELWQAIEIAYLLFGGLPQGDQCDVCSASSPAYVPRLGSSNICEGVPRLVFKGTDFPSCSEGTGVDPSVNGLVECAWQPNFCEVHSD